MTDFQIRVPDELEAGAYANFLSVWHTGHEFTLDFCVTLPPQTEQDPETGQAVVAVPARVSARVKVPPTLAFDIIRALNDNLGKYEDKFGLIRKPGDAQPLPFPQGLLASREGSESVDEPSSSDEESDEERGTDDDD